MSLPRMTGDQRMMAVTMLANAIRKHEPGHVPAPTSAAESDLARQAGARARAGASQQYVRGMIDLLAVLFEGGRPVAEDCYEEARRIAHGTQVPGADRPDLN